MQRWPTASLNRSAVLGHPTISEINPTNSRARPILRASNLAWVGIIPFGSHIGYMGVPSSHDRVVPIPYWKVRSQLSRRKSHEKGDIGTIFGIVRYVLRVNSLFGATIFPVYRTRFPCYFFGEFGHQVSCKPQKCSLFYRGATRNRSRRRPQKSCVTGKTAGIRELPAETGSSQTAWSTSFPPAATAASGGRLRKLLSVRYGFHCLARTLECRYLMARRFSPRSLLDVEPRCSRHRACGTPMTNKQPFSAHAADEMP